MEMDFQRNQTYDRGGQSNDFGNINVANRNRQLGSAAPGGNRGTVTRESNYGVHLSPNERRQNEEINKLGAALFDKSEIGVKDRWMSKRK